MDDYGIAAAALAGLSVYSQASRGSGRTTRLIASLKGGETVVATNLDEARWIARAARDAGIVVNATSAKDMRTALGMSRGPFVFTEQFVEREMRRAVEETAKMFAEFGVMRWRPELPDDYAPDVARDMRRMRI